jgi:hypothetical protein
MVTMGSPNVLREPEDGQGYAGIAVRPVTLSVRTERSFGYPNRLDLLDDFCYRCER